MKIPQNIQSAACGQNIPIFAQDRSFGAPSTAQEARARVASDPAGPQPRAMKFGHRFQQVIEQTHPSASPTRCVHAPRATPRDGGRQKARHETLVRAAWRAAPSARRAGPAPPVSRVARELARDAARLHARALPDATPVRPPRDSPRPTRPFSSLTKANPPNRTRRTSNRRIVARAF